MSLKRSTLKSMGLTEEQVEAIMEDHLETVDGLKSQIKTYKADADRLPGVQKELDELKAAGDGGFKEKYESEKKAFADFKADIASKETKAAKEAAVKAYFEGKNITGKALQIAMRGAAEEIAAIELDGEKIKDTAALDSLISGDYAGLVGTVQNHGAGTPNPPAGNGGNGGQNPANTRAAQLAAQYHQNLYGKTGKE